MVMFPVPMCAQLAAPRVVPVHFAQIARQSHRDLFEHRERLLDVAAREQRLSEIGREARAAFQRAPDPFFLTFGLGRGERFFEGTPRSCLVAAQHRDGSARQRHHGLVRGRVGNCLRGLLDVGSQLERIGSRQARCEQHALQPRLGRIGSAPERVVSSRARFVEARRRGVVRRTRREIGLQAQELRLCHRCERRPLLGERLDARSRPRIAAEVEIEVGEVQERLLGRRSAAGAPAHVDRRLEMRDRLREIALTLRSASEVESDGRHRARFARRFGRFERGFVGGLGLREVLASLKREGQRCQGERLDPPIARLTWPARPPLERLARFVVVPV